MNFLRKYWLPLTLLLMILASLGFFMRKQLWIWFGGWEKTDRGGYVRVTEGKKWDKYPGPGFHIIYQYVVVGPEGDTLVNMARPGVEQHRQYPETPKNELEDAMMHGAPGAVVELLIPTDSLKLRVSNNLQVMNMPSGEYARFIVKIIKVLNDAQLEAYRNQRLFDRLKEENKRIDKLAATVKQNWQLDTFTWVKYYIENPVAGDSLRTGEKVMFNAEVSTIDGQQVINTAPTGKLVYLEIGAGKASLPAYDLIIPKMKPGENGVFLVNSEQGFGAEGYYNIVPPYTPLVVKIKDLKRVKN